MPGSWDRSIMSGSRSITSSTPSTIPSATVLPTGDASASAPAPASNGLGASRTTRHHKYHIPGADLCIILTSTGGPSTMFLFYRYFLERENPNILSDLNSSGGVGSETDPVLIPDSLMSVEDMENILWMFFNETYVNYDGDLTKWVSILKVAYRWNLPGVLRVAQEKLKAQDDNRPLVDRIIFFTKNGLPEPFLFPLYAKLCTRPEAISPEERAQLGDERTCDILLARAEIRSPGGASPVPVGTSPQEAHSVVSRILGIERPTKQNRSASGVATNSSNTVPTIKVPVPAQRPGSSTAK